MRDETIMLFIVIIVGVVALAGIINMVSHDAQGIGTAHITGNVVAGNEGMATTSDNLTILASMAEQSLNCAWGGWFDRDDPSGNGDWETRADFSGVCASPIAIECKTTTGVNWIDAGQKGYICTTQSGGICQNSLAGSCLDYTVRFCCPNANLIPVCTDSDELNYYTYGQVYTKDSADPIITDTCSGSILNEGVCTSSGVATTQAYTCPNGCSDGICLNATPTCTGYDSQTCYISHGTGAQYRTCNNGAWSNWGTCLVQSCDVGYSDIYDNNTCVNNTLTCTGSNTQSCIIANGQGTQSRTCSNGVWSTWGSCSLISCNVGYIVSGNTCVAAPINIQTGGTCILVNTSKAWCEYDGVTYNLTSLGGCGASSTMIDITYNGVSEMVQILQGGQKTLSNGVILKGLGASCSPYFLDLQFASEDQIVENDTGLSLANYPRPFMNSDGTPNALFIVGKKSAIDDVIGITDIVASLQRYAGDNPLPVGLIQFEEDVSDEALYNNNVILVGGMCANTATAKMYGPSEICTSHDHNGVGHIRIIKNKNPDKYVLLVHGYSAQDTTMATRVLASWEDYDSLFDSTDSICITGTSDSMDVRACQ